MGKSETLQIKGVCNTNCSFCNFYEVKGSTDAIKHFEELKQEILNRKKRGERRLSIGIHGYEPTSFEYFFEVLKFAKSYGFYIFLITNGVKFADEVFADKMEGLVDEMYITLYSSNDEEHHILTQNTDPYMIKHYAIENCLRRKIKVSAGILLTKNAVFSFEKILLKLLEYTSNKYFNNTINVNVLSSVMGKERNSILIPSYTSTYKDLGEIASKHHNTLCEKGVTLKVNGIVPLCISKPKNDVLIFSSCNDDIIGKGIYFDVCSKCTLSEDCKGVEPGYLEIYGSSEIVNGGFIELHYSLESIKVKLDHIKQQFLRQGMWIVYEIVEKDNEKYAFLKIFEEKKMLYLPKEILVKNGDVIAFVLENPKNKDTFTVRVLRDESGKIRFSVQNAQIKNKIHELILAIFSKYYEIYSPLKIK